MPPADAVPATSGAAGPGLGTVAVDLVAADLARTTSTFTRDDLLAQLKLLGGHDGRTLGHELDAELARDNPRLVSFSDSQGKPFYSTPEMAACEEAIMADAADMVADRTGHQLNPQVVASTTQAFVENLWEPSPEHEAAMQELLEPYGLAMLSGPPGSGKSRILKGLADAYAAAQGGSRDNVLGTALSQQITAELSGDIGAPGIDLKTLIRQEQNGQSRIPKGGVVLVDEAGLIGSRDMLTLMEGCRSAGAKLVLIGDEKQIAPETAGEPFRVLQKAHPEVTSRLSRIFRQKDAQQQQAGMAIRDGEIAKGMGHYDQQGSIAWCENADSTRQTLVEEGVERMLHEMRDKKEPSTVAQAARNNVFLTRTHKEASVVNAEIRARLKQEGELGKSVPFESLRGPIDLAQDDRIIINQDLVQRGKGGKVKERIMKGSLAAVTDISDKTLTLMTDDKKEMTLPRDSGIDIDHAYALELRSSQGISAKRTYVMIDQPLTPGELTVAATRHKKDIRFAVDSNVYSDVHDMEKKVNAVQGKPMTVELKRQTPATRGSAPAPSGGD